MFFSLGGGRVASWIVPAFVALALGACGAVSRQPASVDLYSVLDDSDVVLAVDAMQGALEREPNGETRSWRNAATGNEGAVTPLRTFITTGGYPCRRYSERLVVGGRSATYENTACRNEDGAWIWIQ